MDEIGLDKPPPSTKSIRFSHFSRYMHSHSDLKILLSAAQGVLRARPSAWLRVSGPDAATFLQGQCTQDLRPLKPGQTTEALWLTPKGRILAETLVLKGDADLWWLWSAHDVGETLRARLEDFIIADDVSVASGGEDWEQVTLAGPAAEIWLRQTCGNQPPPAPGAWTAVGGGLLFAGRRGQAQVWDWLLPRAAVVSAPRPPAALGELSPVAFHRARLAAGVPAIPGEFGPQDLPQEAGLETVAISFTKGCYLGQEVMARLHAMGQVRRRLVRAGGPGPAPTLPVELRQNDKRAGELRAAADDGRGGWLGLALLNLLGLDPAAALATADNRPVRMLDPLKP
jgi:tRNA-modifying protein YgfZ